MFKYRPHRGALEDAMKEAQEFITMDQMFDYIVRSDPFHALRKEDLSITENLGKDDRIDWSETRNVLTKRYGKDVYDTPQAIGWCSMEDFYNPAVITNIFKDSNDDIGIEIRYADDDTIRCYKLYEDTDTDLPICDTHPEYRYDGSESFHYLFITEDTVSKYKNKVWPELFDGGDSLYLEYIETIDPNHANYKFFWPDGFGRESEYLVTLSRDDINELLNNPVSFIYELQDTIEIIGLWKTKR